MMIGIFILINILIKGGPPMGPNAQKERDSCGFFVANLWTNLWAKKTSGAHVFCLQRKVKRESFGLGSSAGQLTAERSECRSRRRRCESALPCRAGSSRFYTNATRVRHDVVSSSRSHNARIEK